MVLLGVLAVGIGCTGGGSGDDDAAPPTSAPTTEEPIPACDVAPIAVAESLPDDVDVGAVPTLPDDVDTGYTGSGPGSGNPYLAPGARQVPGPDMTVTTLGPEPTSVAVAVPPNPDVGSPAAIPATATTVPAPPTTLPPQVTTTPGNTDEATTTTGLMALADDPGCVAMPGDP